MSGNGDLPLSGMLIYCFWVNTDSLNVSTFSLSVVHNAV